VVDRFLADEVEVAGDRGGGGLARGDRVDGDWLIALGEDQHLLRERRLEVLTGTWVLHAVGPAGGEDAFDQALAGAEAARHAVDFAVGEDAAGRLAPEAAAAVGDVPQLAHRLLEADDDVAAFPFVQGREADPPALSHGAVGAQLRCRHVLGARRELAALGDADLRPEAPRALLALAHLRRLALDPMAVEVEAHLDLLSRHEGREGSNHGHGAHDLRLAAAQMADADLYR